MVANQGGQEQSYAHSARRLTLTSRDGNALLLPARQLHSETTEDLVKSHPSLSSTSGLPLPYLHAPTSDVLIVRVREPQDEVMGIGGLGSLDDLLTRGALLAVSCGGRATQTL